MLVKELIKELQMLNSNDEVVFVTQSAGPVILSVQKVNDILILNGVGERRVVLK